MNSTYNRKLSLFNPCNKFPKAFLMLLLAFSSCEKFVDIDPPKTATISEVVFSSDATAISAIRGIYSEMSRTGFASGIFSSVTIACANSADELMSFSYAGLEAFYTNSLTPFESSVVNQLWNAGYTYIYYANAVIERLNTSTNVSVNTKKQLEGEAKFLRAFCNFYLVNLFGDVPLINTTDYRISSIASRVPKEQLYQQIVTDLIDAQNLLAADYSWSNNERVRVNKWAATALLARVYLYLGDWAKAETQATAVLDNTGLFSLTPDLNSVFLKNSGEAIWQLMPVQPGTNTNEALYFIPSSFTSVPQFVALTSQLVTAFETGDNRQANWIRSYTVGSDTFNYPYKYKVRLTGEPVTEYSMVLRLAEQYLIRAEARAQGNNILGAQSDLNAIRNRAFGAPNPTTANDKSSLLLAIEQERRKELFAEWGHRWLDLKRWNRADAVLEAIKAPNWQSTDVLYPIPQSDLNNNPNLTQNPGY